MTSKADLIFQFRERAAIREYEGGETRNVATYNAANELRRQIAPERLPVEILQEVNAAGKDRSLFS
jgi:hypothetical protein